MLFSVNIVAEDNFYCYFCDKHLNYVRIETFYQNDNNERYSMV